MKSPLTQSVAYFKLQAIAFLKQKARKQMKNNFIEI